MAADPQPLAALLTPPGAAAIGVVAIAGPGAWNLVQAVVRSSSRRPWPEHPTPPQFWLGVVAHDQTAGDEVIVSCLVGPPEEWVEVQGHGGTQVTRRLLATLTAAGAREVPASQLPPRHPPGTDPRALALLPHALTPRTAAILLDQLQGALIRAEALIEANSDSPIAARLQELIPVGQHLTTPWQLVIAGPPNVGKSSLVNALAGFTRSVVSPTAGTTRDLVTTRLAFDGWPVELIDTAGLRTGETPLEAAGINRARDRLATADLVLWVFDATASEPVWPTDADHLPPGRVLHIVNKIDQPPAWDLADQPELVQVSAQSDAGLNELIVRIVRQLIPVPPAPGEAVPLPNSPAPNVGSPALPPIH